MIDSYEHTSNPIAWMTYYDVMFDVVTGGAGFIGSHLIDTLVAQGNEVLVIDSLSSGKKDTIARHIDSCKVRFVQKDLLDDGWQESIQGADRLFHLAADPDVRQSAVNPEPTMQNNIMATYRVLEAMRLRDIPELVFTSTSTVYGDATVIPTPESYTPLEPISVYGASKLACEALISAYCHSFGMKAWIFRFANIIGSRSGHGVIIDFIRKLEENPAELEILGNGKQTKSYLEVHECIAAMLFAVGHSRDTVNTFNIGSEDWIDVKSIAGIVAEEMHLPLTKFRFTGGERGWVGDVPKMQLAIDRIKGLRWKPQIGSRESVRTAVRAMLAERQRQQ
jgi:UDP-glucose 4-epimerase